MEFKLASGIDVERLRGRFIERRRVRITPFLAHEQAVRLREHLAAREDWRQVINSGEKVFELDRATRAAMTPAQTAALDMAVAAGARDGFQYRYEAIRVPDGTAARAAADGPLPAFARWMSSGVALALLRRVTGADDIGFADAQATAYAPGDLLTAHNDNVAGKDRRAAYVFGLTTDWRPEWGGLLLFHDRDGEVSGRAPAFNALDLFAVPQDHSVSQVTTAAPNRRYSITGWLRAQHPPE